MSAAAALPSWMRVALFATALMNTGAAVVFLPFAGPLRELAGFPVEGHPLHAWTIALFVFLFALGYLYLAITGTPSRPYIAWAAAGKLSFFTLVTVLGLSGDLPMKAIATAAPDLAFGLLFAGWALRKN